MFLRQLVEQGFRFSDPRVAQDHVGLFKAVVERQRLLNGLPRPDQVSQLVEVDGGQFVPDNGVLWAEDGGLGIVSDRGINISLLVAFVQVGPVLVEPPQVGGVVRVERVDAPRLQQDGAGGDK